MALTGRGAIIIWNDITPAGLAQFYDWHHHEHMPERLGIAGFRRGSRYAAATPDTSPFFLTVYELADRGVATSEGYLARLNAPTEWSRSTMLNFRNMIRALTEVEVSLGEGPGGAMVAVRFNDDDEGRAALAKVRAEAGAMAALIRMPRISGAHLCVTDAGASAAKTAESRHRNDSIVAPIGAVLIEGCDSAAVDAAAAHLIAKFALPPAAVTLGSYRLEHAIAAA